MQINHVQWRVDFASALFEMLSFKTDVDAFFIGGSVARGFADEFSDLELCCVWPHPPTNDQRRSIIKKWAGISHYDFDERAAEEPYNHADTFEVRGLQVDLWHLSRKTEDDIIHSVVDLHNTKQSSLNSCETIQSCVPLFDPNQVIGKWKEKLSAYPDKLAIKVITENLDFLQSGNLEMHLAREDYTSAFSIVAGLQKRIYNILLALNKMYFPSYKRMSHYLAKMDLAPSNVTERFRTQLTSNPILNDDLVSLQNETLDLIKSRFPQISTENARLAVNDKRRVWKTPIATH